MHLRHDGHTLTERLLVGAPAPSLVGSCRLSGSRGRLISRENKDILSTKTARSTVLHAHFHDSTSDERPLHQVNAHFIR